MKQVLAFETMRRRLNKGGVGLRWGHTQSRPEGKSTVQAEREAILWIFKEQTKEAKLAEMLTNLPHFGSG